MVRLVNGNGEGARARVEDDFIELHVRVNAHTRFVGYAESGHVAGAVGNGGRRPVGSHVPLVGSWVEAPHGAVGVHGVQRAERKR